MGDAQPVLIIRYSSDFSLSIQFSQLQSYPTAAPDYRFQITSRIHHPTGEFTYNANDIYFAPQVFLDFAQQLDGIAKGTLEHASFYDYGHMIEFSLVMRKMKPHVSIKICEHQAGAEPTLLSAAFPVDFDLFVNALRDKTMQFFTELEAACAGPSKPK